MGVWKDRNTNRWTDRQSFTAITLLIYIMCFSVFAKKFTNHIKANKVIQLVVITCRHNNFSLFFCSRLEENLPEV